MRAKQFLLSFVILCSLVVLIVLFRPTGNSRILTINQVVEQVAKARLEYARRPLGTESSFVTQQLGFKVLNTSKIANQNESVFLLVGGAGNIFNQHKVFLELAYFPDGKLERAVVTERRDAMFRPNSDVLQLTFGPINGSNSGMKLAPIVHHR